MCCQSPEHLSNHFPCGRFGFLAKTTKRFFRIQALPFPDTYPHVSMWKMKQQMRRAPAASSAEILSRALPESSFKMRFDLHLLSAHCVLDSVHSTEKLCQTYFNCSKTPINLTPRLFEFTKMFDAYCLFWCWQGPSRRLYLIFSLFDFTSQQLQSNVFSPTIRSNHQIIY